MKGRPIKKSTPYVELQQSWNETKPRILKYLNDGWSKSVAFKKAGLLKHSDLYHLCYCADKEFKELISKYNQGFRGHYNNAVNQR